MDLLASKLCSCSWNLLQTNDESDKWIFKFLCENDSCHIVLSDLSDVFVESLTLDQITERFKELNKRLEAPTCKVLNHVEESLIQHHNNKFKSQVENGSTVCLSFLNSFYGIPFQWSFVCKKLLNIELVTRSLVCQPLLLAATHLMCENQKLKEIILKKDEEIKDYRDSGYKVSRPHLKTEIFDQNKHEQHLTQSRDYAALITKDPMSIIVGKSLNKVMTVSSSNSQCTEISILSSSPVSKKPAAVGQSPLRKQKLRKHRPTVRGCVMDSTENEDVDQSTESFNVDRKNNIVEVPQPSKKPRKAKRRQLF